MGEAVWQDICPVCNGTGQLQTKDRKGQVIHILTVCEACNGKGTILIVKKLRKKGK